MREDVVRDQEEVRTTVTPKGVEHERLFGGARSRKVRTTVTPKGVEHRLLGGDKEDGGKVRTTVTPKGVEHLLRCTVRTRPSACEPQ